MENKITFTLSTDSEVIKQISSIANNLQKITSLLEKQDAIINKIYPSFIDEEVEEEEDEEEEESQVSSVPTAVDTLVNFLEMLLK